MVIVFIATTVALEASFAIGWWLIKKSAAATYYVSTNTAIALYNVYQEPPEWIFAKNRMYNNQLAIEN